MTAKAAGLAIGLLILVSCGKTPSAEQTQYPVRTSEMRDAGQSTATGVEWPSDTRRQSTLEAALGIPVGATPLDVYIERQDILTAICMSDGGFQIEPGGALGSELAFERYQGEIHYRGEIVGGGCSAWGVEHAFPGNHFGAEYLDLLERAIRMPEYEEVVSRYDSCLRAAGHDAVPVVDGLTDEEAQAAHDVYTAAATECSEDSGRAAADRAVEIYAGDMFASLYPGEVASYVDTYMAEMAKFEQAASQ